MITKNRTHMFFFYFCFAILINFVVYKGYDEYTNITAKIEAQELKIKELTIENSKLNGSNILITEEYNNVISSYVDTISELRVQISALTHRNETYDPIINRSKIYKKVDTSYMNYEFVSSIFNLAKTKNIDPYIIFAIIDTESNFNANAKSKYASAIGLGQITDFTGKFIHNGLLKKKTPYVHDMLLNPSLNVSYMIEYLVYLTNKHKSYDRAIKEYCGGFMKGYEDFYETKYRPKLVRVMKIYGLTEQSANAKLRGKPPAQKK